MRWNRTNVTSMATLVSLWANNQWERYRQSAA